MLVSRRQEANTTLYTSVQLREDILNHLLDILSSERSSALISDHQNIYKSLILNNGVEHVRSNILHALVQDIKVLFQKGVLTFETLSSLDRKKAEEYNTAGVYLHAIYELEQPSIYWLYVGAGMDVQNRVEEHKHFRTIPSRTLFIIESGIKRVGAISSFCLEDSRISTFQNETRWP
jgi:hypothetical protein